METKTITKSKFLEFKSAKSPSGHDWFYVKRTNDTNLHDSAVVLTTIIKKNDGYYFLFLKTQRPPIYAENKAKNSIESPAGLIGDIDKNEDLISCIKKELKEETGYEAQEIFIEAQNYSTSNGLSSETLTFATVIAKNNLAFKPVNDGGIITDRFYVKVEEINNYLKTLNYKETSVATALITGIFFAQNRLKNLN